MTFGAWYAGMRICRTSASRCVRKCTLTPVFLRGPRNSILVDDSSSSRGRDSVPAQCAPGTRYCPKCSGHRPAPDFRASASPDGHRIGPDDRSR
jgi:hypothetical protein